MYFAKGSADNRKIEPVSPWCLLPMWLALIPLLAMGLWWPNLLWEHFQTIAHALDATHSAEGTRWIGTHIEQVWPNSLQKRAEALHASGGRVQFAYAWSPVGDPPEVRYVASVPEDE